MKNFGELCNTDWAGADMTVYKRGSHYYVFAKMPDDSTDDTAEQQ